MTADERALLDSVIAAPDDDTPRLVYADWLDEHGESERAEFIRVQCELARVRIADPGGRAKYDQFSRRCQELYAAHGRGWERGALSDLPANRQLTVLFWRGMVGEVWCTAKYFIQYGHLLGSRFPIRQLRLSRLSEKNARQIGGCDSFRSIPGIRFDAYATPASEVLAVLTHCPLSHIRSFTLGDSFING